MRYFKSRERFLKVNENSFHDYSDDYGTLDMLVSTYLNKNGENSSTAIDANDHWIENYAEENDISVDDVFDNEGFLEMYRSMVSERMSEFEGAIYNRMDGDELTVYRKMTIDDNWLAELNKGTKLGIYWSWDEDAADTHWGNSEHTSDVLITAIVKDSDVDWHRSYLMNCSDNYQEEKEITIIEGSKLQLVEVKINDEPVDISKLHDMKYAA